MTNNLTIKERNKLVEENLNLARKLASSFKHSWCEYDELLSTAYSALCEAARTFDPENGTKFSTHAYTKIKFSLLSIFRSNNVFSATDSEKSITELSHSSEENFDINIFLATTKNSIDVKSIMLLLSPLEFKVISGFYLEDINREEIMETNNISKYDFYQLRQSAIQKMTFFIKNRKEFAL